MLNRRVLGIVLIIAGILLSGGLFFLKAHLDTQGAALCKAVEANPDMTMDECPAHKSGPSWALMFSFGIATIIIVAGAYLVIPPQSKKPKKMPKLDDDEKKIVDLLRSHDGSLYQSDLIKETEFSKVKMTRILDRLEGKHVIDRKRRGMTNMIILKD